jgi:hypothetical protein
MPQAPQLVGDSSFTCVPVKRLTHVPEQLVSPLGHAHADSLVDEDIEHVIPPMHVIDVDQVPADEHRGA